MKFPKCRFPKRWETITDPVLPLEHNSVVIHSMEWYGNASLKKFAVRTMGNNCWMALLYIHRKLALFLSVYVDDINLAGRDEHSPTMRARPHPNKLIWEIPHPEWTKCILAALSAKPKLLNGLRCNIQVIYDLGHRGYTRNCW